MNHDMTNIAYTPEYQAQRQKWAAVFAPENLQDTEEFTFEGGYALTRHNYFCKIEEYHITGSETIVVLEGEEIYRWRNTDNSGEFVELIRHSNGRSYLLFRIDLYGYGVFDLTDRKDFFYIPKVAETFIWTDVHYCPQSDMLAVDGCYWACPNGVHLVEFSDPMRESTWVDVIKLLDGDYDTYDGAEFARWDGDALVVKADRLLEQDGKWTTVPEEISIAREKYF